MASYGVIYGPSVQTRIPGSGVTRLPVSGIASSFGIAPGLTPDTFVVSAPDNYQIDFELNANGLYNDAAFELELYNETLGAVVQSRRSVGPQQGRAEDLWFGFEFSVVNPAHEYSFRIRPIRALGDNFLVMQDQNFRAVIQAFISAGGGAISGAGTPGAICKFTAPQVIGDSIISESGSVVSVAGSVNLVGNNTDTFLSMQDGQNVPVSAANEGRIRYNAAIQTFEVSENGGAWHDLTGVGPGTVNRVPKFTAATVIGDSAVSDDGSVVTVAEKLLVQPTVAPVGNLVYECVGDGFAGRYQFTNYVGAGLNGPNLNLRRARGTSAAPTAVQNNDLLGFLGFIGYGTTTFPANSDAAILARASENFTDAAHGTRLSLETTPNGTVSRVERVRIEQDGTFTFLNSVAAGYLKINNTTAATSKVTGALQVVGGVGIGGDLYSARYFLWTGGTGPDLCIIANSAEDAGFTSLWNLVLRGNYQAAVGAALPNPGGASATNPCTFAISSRATAPAFAAVGYVGQTADIEQWATANAANFETYTVRSVVKPSGAFVIGGTALVGSELLRVVGAARVEGKLTVTGGIDPTYLELAGTASDTYLNMTDGSSVPVSAANEGRIRYNAAIQTFEVSENGGAWHDLTGITPGTVNRIAKFTAVDAVGNSQITDDGLGEWTFRDGARQIMSIGKTAAPFSSVDLAGVNVILAAADANSTTATPIDFSTDPADFTTDGSYASYRTNTEHGLTPGQTVVITGFTDDGFNGTFIVYDCPEEDVFRIANTSLLTCTVVGTGVSYAPLDGGCLILRGGASAGGGYRGTVLCPGEGVKSTVIGPQSFASQNGSTSIGNSCEVTSPYSAALGVYATASGPGRAACLGVSSTAIGEGAVAVGSSCNADGKHAMSFGGGNARGEKSCAFGLCSAIMEYAVSVGHGSATAANAIALGSGPFTTASAVDAISIGNGVRASGVRGISIGTGADHSDVDVMMLWDVLKVGLSPTPWSKTGVAGADVTLRARDGHTNKAGGSIVLQAGAPISNNPYGAIECIGRGLAVTQQPAVSGSPSALLVTGGAHIQLAASAEAIDVNFNLARTVRFSTGAIDTQRAMVIQAPTYAFLAASTITTAATFAVTGAPVAGANATIADAISLWVMSGKLALGTSNSANGILSIYNSANAHTITIQSGVTSASYTLTLPTVQGSVNSVMLNDGGGALIWSTNVQVNAIATKTGAYAITNTDDVILCDASGGAFTVTLPTAVGIAAKRFTVKRIDGSANSLTLATTSSQTIDGATTLAIPSRWTSVTVVSDGSNWFVI